MGVVRKSTSNLLDMPNCPTALGVATDDMGHVVYPEIAFDAVQGGVRFRVATSDYMQASPSVLLVEKGTHVVGLGQFNPGPGPVTPAVYEYNATVGGAVPINVYVPPVAKHAWVGAVPTPPKRTAFKAVLQLDQKTFDAVKNKEDEHLADFEEAYKLTAKAVAERINSLAGTVFLNEDEAMRELLSFNPPLDRRLVPTYPLELSSWKPHLLKTADALADLSKQRDGGGTKEHCPDGYDATLDWNSKPTPTLTFQPRMRTMSTATATLIRLDKLPAASWDGVTLRPPTGPTLTPGQTAKVTVDTKTKAYSQKGESGWMFNGDPTMVVAGLSCTVEEIGGDGVWVSVTQVQGNSDPRQRKMFLDYFSPGGAPVSKVWLKLPAHLLA